MREKAGRVGKIVADVVSFFTGMPRRIKEGSVPDDPIKVEARRIIEEIGLETRKNLPNISRKDIPKVLEMLSQQNDRPTMVKRQPNEVSVVLFNGGINMSVRGVDDKEGALNVTINGEEYSVHYPRSVGDMLISERINEINKDKK
jgi:hypothetical protein